LVIDVHWVSSLKKRQPFLIVPIIMSQAKPTATADNIDAPVKQATLVLKVSPVRETLSQPRISVPL